MTFNSFAFDMAMRNYHTIAEKYGDDSDQAIQGFMKCFDLAPQHLKDEVDKMAKQMGLLPKLSGFTDDGEPLFSIADVAKHFGMSEAEIMADIDCLDPSHARQYHGNINRIQ